MTASHAKVEDFVARKAGNYLFCSSFGRTEKYACRRGRKNPFRSFAPSLTLHSQVSGNDILSSQCHGMLGCWDVLPFPEDQWPCFKIPQAALFIGGLCLWWKARGPPTWGQADYPCLFPPYGVARTHFRISSRLEACNSL